MAEKISDNVGKKIVEALKMQNSSAQSPEDNLIDNPVDVEPVSFDNTETTGFVNSKSIEIDGDEHLHDLGFSQKEQSFTASDSDIDNIFQSNLNLNLGVKQLSVEPQIDFELPNNVAILNRLISKLPVGVSKPTGAMIISQTMEALGISMNSVIQEAKEVQDSLTNNARECQKTIIDYRKQIAELEVKAQQYQRQAVTMNDVINLFTHS